MAPVGKHSTGNRYRQTACSVRTGHRPWPNRSRRDAPDRARVQRLQANAIIAAALNPAVGEDVLDALATPKYTAAQSGHCENRYQGRRLRTLLDPQMDARRMEAAYLVVAHGGSDLPVERLSRSQLLTINNILLQGHIPY